MKEVASFPEEWNEMVRQFRALHLAKTLSQDSYRAGADPSAVRSADVSSQPGAALLSPDLGAASLSEAS